MCLSPFEKDQLPEDIWVEIFIRSSVESLLRVKAVCKLWYALIKSPYFTKRHLEYQKMISRNRGLFLLQQFCLDIYRSYCFLFDEESLASGATSASSSSSILLDPCIHFSCMVQIHGPINGLYCIYSGDDRLVILNPATSEVGFLSLPQKFISDKVGIHFGAIGFGTDPLDEDDYKVMLFCQCGDEMHNDEFQAMLYTSSTNTWRLVDDLGGLDITPDPWCFSSNNTYLNGIYYWLYNGFEEVVLAFDMGKKEAFRKIPIPHLILEDEKYSDVALHEDHIALFVVNKNLYDLDIWALMVEDHSWIKMISVKGVQRIISSRGFSRMEDEVFLVIDDDYRHHNYQTVVYNTTTQKVIRNVGPGGYFEYFRTSVYYESLVSVTGGMTKYKGNHASVLDAVSSFLYPVRQIL